MFSESTRRLINLHIPEKNYWSSKLQINITIKLQVKNWLWRKPVNVLTYTTLFLLCIS